MQNKIIINHWSTGLNILRPYHWTIGYQIGSIGITTKDWQSIRSDFTLCFELQLGRGSDNLNNIMKLMKSLLTKAHLPWYSLNMKIYCPSLYYYHLYSALCIIVYRTTYEWQNLAIYSVKVINHTFILLYSGWFSFLGLIH